ncbi:MAG: sn-glycerol-3-phosphate ABC transporter ATP-binding protein UgpC [Alphaproteobacteria bacterium]
MVDVVLSGLTKRFGDVEAVRGVDLTVRSGEFCVLVGPSGCGKSTLLRMIAGLEEIDGGELAIDGRRMNEVRPADRGVSMVFQSYALYPHMTVYRNMAFGLKLARTAAETIDERVRSAARTLQIEDLLDRRPRELSGGQRQRVAIGRAIVRQPKVFLFDEPLSNLDASLRVQMRLEIARLHRRLGSTAIYVTHDQTEAMTLADKIVVLNQGTVEQAGAPLDLYRRPDNLFVATFLGSPRINLLPARVEPGQGAMPTFHVGDAVFSLPASFAPPADGEVMLGVRPEHIRVTHPGTDADLTMRVDLVEELGEAQLLHGTVAEGQSLIVRYAERADVAAGDEVGIGFSDEDMLLFDKDGRRIPHEL